MIGETPEAPAVEVEIESPETEVEIVEVEVVEPELPLVNTEIVEPEVDIKEVQVEVEEVEVPEMPEPAEATPIAVETPKEQPTVIMPQIEDVIGQEESTIVLNPEMEVKPAVAYINADEAIASNKGLAYEFEDEAYYLPKNMYTSLDKLVETMHRFPSLKAKLQGHTKSDEMSYFHQQITRKRVYYIQNYLVTKGIDLKRIDINFFDENAGMSNKQFVNVELSR